MKCSCNFTMNPAYVIGMILLFISVTARHLLEVEGIMLNACELLSGAASGLLLFGLLYGSPKTRPLFNKLHAFKLQLLGRA